MELIKKHCIAVGLDNCQAPRGFAPGSGLGSGATLVLVTARGQVVAQVRAGGMAAALAKWNSLPESERRPGAVKPEEIEPDAIPLLEPPPGSLVLKVFMSALERGSQGEYQRRQPPFWGAGPDVKRDILWVTESEWKALVPAQPRPGDQRPAPATLRERMFRCCTRDIWRCYKTPHFEFWRREALRSSELTVRVEEVTDRTLRLELRGRAVLAGDPNERPKFSYEGSLLGRLEYDRPKGCFTRFDVVGVGDNLVEDVPASALPDFQAHKALGQLTMGFALELAPRDSAFYHVPPAYLNVAWRQQQNSWLDLLQRDYLGNR